MKEVQIYRDSGPIDISIIEAFEKKAGYCLPQSYRVLISSHDWLYPVQNTFTFINIYGHHDSRDISFYGYGDEPIRHGEGIIYNQDFDVYGCEGIVAFGCSANGDYICFDYRHEPRTCEPRVVLMYHDDYIEDENGKANMVVNDVASSFDGFINILYKYEEERINVGCHD